MRFEVFVLLACSAVPLVPDVSRHRCDLIFAHLISTRWDRHTFSHNAAIRCYSLLLPSLEVPLSKLDPNTNYLELEFAWLSSIPPSCTNSEYVISFPINYSLTYGVVSKRQFLLITRSFHAKKTTLILLRWRIWWAPSNASKWQMGFNSAFKGLNIRLPEFLCLLNFLCPKCIHMIAA